MLVVVKVVVVMLVGGGAEPSSDTASPPPASLQHLDVEEAQSRKPLRHGVRRQLPPGEHGGLIPADVLQPKLVGRTTEVPREVLDGADVSVDGRLGVVAAS